MKIIHEITLDLSRHGVQCTIPLTQHSAGMQRLVIRLRNGSVPILLDKNISAVLYLDTDVYDPVTTYTENGAYSNCLVYDVSASATSTEGAHKAVLQLFETAEKLCFSPEFAFFVRNDVTIGSAILNSSPYAAVLKLRDEVYVKYQEIDAIAHHTKKLVDEINFRLEDGEIIYIKGEKGDKGDKGDSGYSDIVQTLGVGTTAVMSQAAVTQSLNNLESKLTAYVNKTIESMLADKSGIFYIDSTGLTFEVGMTWAEWIASAFNTCGMIVKDDTVYADPMETQYLSLDGSSTWIQGSDVIVNGSKYRTGLVGQVFEVDNVKFLITGETWEEQESNKVNHSYSFAIKNGYVFRDSTYKNLLMLNGNVVRSTDTVGGAYTTNTAENGTFKFETSAYFPFDIGMTWAEFASNSTYNINEDVEIQGDYVMYAGKSYYVLDSSDRKMLATATIINDAVYSLLDVNEAVETGTFNLGQMVTDEEGNESLEYEAITFEVGTTWAELSGHATYDPDGDFSVKDGYAMYGGGGYYILDASGMKQLGTAEIVNEASYTLLDVNEKAKITFTIDGTTYYAEEGMTWSAWCSSAHNTLGLVCMGGVYTTENLDSPRVLDASGNYLDEFDTIIANHAYVIEDIGDDGGDSGDPEMEGWTQIEYTDPSVFAAGGTFKAVCTPDSQGNMCYIEVNDGLEGIHTIFSHYGDGDTEVVELVSTIEPFTIGEDASVYTEMYYGSVSVYKKDESSEADWKLLTPTELGSDDDLYQAIMTESVGDAEEVYCYSGIPSGTKMKLICNYTENETSGYDVPWREYSGVSGVSKLASGEELIFTADGADIVIYRLGGGYSGTTSHELYADGFTNSTDDSGSTVETITFTIEDAGTYQAETGMTWSAFASHATYNPQGDVEIKNSYAMYGGGGYYIYNSDGLQQTGADVIEHGANYTIVDVNN